jgi:flagellar hook-basal body complex protein FliE
MSIEPIAFLPPVAMPAMPELDNAAAVPGGQFGAWFTQQMSEVNNQLQLADRGVQQLAVGDAPSLHEVMMNLEQAKLSMQLVLQVRGHLLDAYHDLMQMQV